jgi:hypothetical protein
MQRSQMLQMLRFQDLVWVFGELFRCEVCGCDRWVQGLGTMILHKYCT